MRSAAASPGHAGSRTARGLAEIRTSRRHAGSRSARRRAGAPEFAVALVRITVVLVGMAAALAGTHSPAEAQSLAGLQIRLDMEGDGNADGSWDTDIGWLYLQHNRPLDGPRASYIPFTFTNTSGTTLTNLTATLGGLSTAGTIRLGGGASPQVEAQYIGALEPGERRYLYWYVEYDDVFGAVAPITVTVSDGASSQVYDATLRTTQANRTQAGGVNQNMVIGEGAVVGQTIWIEATNTFGNTRSGDVLMLQPTGGQGFPAGCFQLTGSEIIESTVNAIPVGTRDRIWFVATGSQGGSGHTARIRYYFRYKCANTAAWVYPFAAQRSGNSIDFSGVFESDGGEPGDPGEPGIPPAPDPSYSFEVWKSATPDTIHGGGTFTFRLSIENSSDQFGVTIDSIVDLLPAGMTFQAMTGGSDVTAGNSGSHPGAGASGRLTWIGDGEGYPIAALDTLVLEYAAAVGPVPGDYTNLATPYVGETALPSGSYTVTVMPAADVAVALSGPEAAFDGDTLAYVIETTNLGPNLAEAVVVAAVFPEGFELAGTSRPLDEAAASAPTWPALAELEHGATHVDTILVVAMPAGSHTLIALATASTFDPDPGNNDGTAEASRVEVAVSGVGVAVTPDGLEEPRKDLPGTGYAQAFTVASGFDVEATFDLLAAVAGAAEPALLVIDSVTAAGVPATASADSNRVALGAADSAVVEVWYTVAPGAMQTDTLRLVARPLTHPHASDDGFVEVRRIAPGIVLARSVDPSAGIAPGIDVVHTLQLGNPGDVAARDVVVVDDLPTQVEFKLGSAAAAETPPGVGGVSIQYSTDGAAWDYTPSDGGCGAAPGYDACVRAIRWELQGDFDANTAPGASLLTFIVRVR